MKKFISAILILLSLNTFASTVTIDNAVVIRKCSNYSLKKSYVELEKETLNDLQEMSAEKCSQAGSQNAEVHVYYSSEDYLLAARKVCVRATLVCK